MASLKYWDGAAWQYVSLPPVAASIAFSAYLASNQALPGNWQKVQCGTKEFDTDNLYNASTYRFQPTKAGYYRLSAACQLATTYGQRQVASIWKNGGEFKRLADNIGGGSSGFTNEPQIGGSCIVYANGSTDYFEFYVYTPAAGQTLQSSALMTWFQGESVYGSTAESWHEVGAAGEPAFTTGWGNQGGSDATAAFRFCGGNMIAFKGTIKATNGSPVGGNTIFTLPAAYRPSANRRLATVIYDPSQGGGKRVPCMVYVRSDGGIYVYCEGNGVPNPMTNQELDFDLVMAL
jgi:hypothetical protein